MGLKNKVSKYLQDKLAFKLSLAFSSAYDIYVMQCKELSLTPIAYKDFVNNVYRMMDMKEKSKHYEIQNDGYILGKD